MRTNPYITRAILLGTAFAASSCMMGPDFKPVDMPMPAAFRGAPAATESIADLPWWKVFKNKDLQDLLTDTYNNNRDLKATMARVEKARQYITIMLVSELPSNISSQPISFFPLELMNRSILLMK